MGYRYAIFVLSLFWVVGGQASARAADTLQDFRWQKRLLLVHPSDEAALNQLTVLIDQHQSEITERKLQIFVTWRNRLLTFPEAEHNLKATEVLRELVGQQAQMLLIGLDGGIKQNDEQVPINFDKIFALIDGMPMRQSELREAELDDSQ